MSNYYDLLNVSREASAEEIKVSHRKLAFRLHPDRNPGDLQSVEDFKLIQAAYDVLSDFTRRRKYDLTLPKKVEIKKKPVVKQENEKQENDLHGFVYADAPPPKHDLWGKPIGPARNSDFYDVFSYEYESPSGYVSPEDMERFARSEKFRQKE